MIQEDADPNQLKAIITDLIAKSKQLVAELNSALNQLELSREHESFWRNCYYKLEAACGDLVNQSRNQLKI